VDDGVGRPTEATKETTKKRKPILLLCPGIGGSIRALYMYGMLWHARTKGYKVGRIYFRTADEIPVTANKMSCFSNWEDVKTVLEHVHKKYVMNAETGKKQTRLYTFGCSMGANQLGLYLINEGKRASEIVDGACLYAAPWNCKDNNEFFVKSMFGLP